MLNLSSLDSHLSQQDGIGMPSAAPDTGRLPILLYYYETHSSRIKHLLR